MIISTPHAIRILEGRAEELRASRRTAGSPEGRRRVADELEHVCAVLQQLRRQDGRRFRGLEAPAPDGRRIPITVRSGDDAAGTPARAIVRVPIQPRPAAAATSIVRSDAGVEFVVVWSGDLAQFAPLSAAARPFGLRA
jgi:hypothetical protein